MDLVRRSGFTIFVSLVNPLPEKSAYANVLASYAPTDIARLAEDGIVSVVASVGNSTIPSGAITVGGYYVADVKTSRSCAKT